MSALSALAAIALAAVHVAARRLRIATAVPRSAWLSVAGGASVSYVFVHVFPELSARQEALSATVGWLDHHAYLVALAGFAAFYGIERFAIVSRDRRAPDGETTPADAVFWLHVGAFGTYNALIGYLLVHREEPGTASLALFAFAMALHFAVNDYGLRRHHESVYDTYGRWLLAAAVLVGWAVGRTVRITDAGLALLFAVLAGGVILNVIKEELPEENDSRFWAFVGGAAGYAAILLLA